MSKNNNAVFFATITAIVLFGAVVFFAPSPLDKYKQPVNYDPPYHYGDKVRMIGFYAECAAIIEDFNYPNEYNVQLVCEDKNKTISVFNKWVNYADIAERIQ